jgi:tetratricopeptide (TPR) repeat protein
MAVEKDPGFALAWAYLAAAASVSWGYGTAISNEEAHILAEHASAKALELEPGMGLALAVQASQAYGHAGDLTKAFHLFDRAFESDPNDTTIRLWLGMYLHHWGYLGDALPHLRFAFSRNPRLGITNGCLGLLYLAQGRDDLARQYLAKAWDLGWIHHVPAQASKAMMAGEFDSAFAYLKSSVVFRPSVSEELSWFYELEEAGRAYDENPDSAESLAAVVDRAPDSNWQKTYLSLIFNLKDPFFDHFSRTVEESHRWNALMRIVWLPDYRGYVEDPRFLEIMDRDGAVALWEQRGYPDGCVHVRLSGGDRLDCSNRYEVGSWRNK